MRLLVDSGNTFLKWGVHDGSKWLKVDRLAQKDLANLSETWDTLPEITSITVSNVAGDDSKLALTELLSRWTIKPHWLIASQSACGLNNLYLQQEKLGSDRWASMIAAWKLYQQSCLVVTVGTAMTVDMISKSGNFMGGYIMPGPDSLFNSLEMNTKLGKVQHGVYTEFPRCTEDAVYSGVINCLVGSIQRVYKIMGSKSATRCIVSGGAASLILPYLDPQVEFIDNLVLEGLLIVTKERESH